MGSVTITKTKEFLIFKIPLAALQKRQTFSREEKAVREGLRAVARGRISKSFHTAESAAAFLRNI